MSIDSTPKSGLYYVIPSAIMDNEHLLPMEKLLYALLSGFAHADGTCYPSDKYLATRLKESIRNIQFWINHLDKLGFISRETKCCSSNPFKKFRVITVHTEFSKVSKNVHEPQSIAPSNAQPIAVPSLQPIAVIVGKENSIVSEENVLYPDPVGSEKESSSSKEESINIALEGISLPQEVEKYHPNGSVIKTRLNDVFLHATKTRRDWTSSEIHDAWKIYADYDGSIREPLHFIAGTIKNLRTNKQTEYLKKRGIKKCPNEELMKYDESKAKLLAEDTQERVSLASLLGMTNRD